ncbi:MAG: YetF domain-containing protein [Bacteroidota bacterium]
MNLQDVIGEVPDLTFLQVGIRGFVVFIIALALLRLAGRRAFGMGTAFDNVICMLLGAVLSRAVVGASPFMPTVTGAVVIVAFYRLFAWLSLKSHRFGKLVKGESELIYENGKMNREHMNHCLVTEKDLLERVHHEAHVDSLEDIDKAYLERDGAISVIKKRKQGEKC